jgi:V8-like Glu-specific endopeptidase
VSVTVEGKTFTFLQLAQAPDVLPRVAKAASPRASRHPAEVATATAAANAGDAPFVVPGGRPEPRVGPGGESGGQDTLFDFLGKPGVEQPIGRIDFVAWYADETGLPANATRVPNKYRASAKAFGYMSNGCTITHLGGGVAVTAGHCFFENKRAAVEKLECPSGTWIQWGRTYLSPSSPVEVRPQPEDFSDCVQIAAAEYTDQRDYAVVLVKPAPAASLAASASKRPAVDRSVTIFGHPGRAPLTWSRLCTVRASADLPWAEYHHPSRLAHQCDTLPSSSGSPIIDDATLEVVGVHDGGGITGTRADGTNDGWNFGTFLFDTPVGQLLPK